MDMIATEQERISTALDAVEKRLASAHEAFATLEANLSTALDLARDCHRAYLEASPQVRRLFNQAFFTKLMIDDEDEVQQVYAEPFAALLDKKVRSAARGCGTPRRRARPRWPTPWNERLKLEATNMPLGRFAPPGACLWHL